MGIRNQFKMLAVIALSVIVIAALWTVGGAEAAPNNAGLTRIVVTDFSADNTGNSDARPGIQAAINACTASTGCEIYFPPGAYALYTPPPSASAVISIPNNVPITLAGASQFATTLEAMQPMSGGVSYDIIGVGTGSTGFKAHDFGVQVSPATSGGGASGGAIFHMPGAKAVSIFNIFVDGGFDIFQLGDITSTSVVNDQTYIRSISSENGNDCFLRLDGGVSNTFVRGIYAQANETPGSQILCLPSSQTGAIFPGVSELHIVDSSFEGFVRGFSVTSAQFNVTGLYLDDIYLDTADDGPSLEFFKSPDSLATLSNVNVANMTVVSSATACVIRGGVSGISLNNVTCGGAARSGLPSPCSSPSSQRGFALVDISGTATGPGTVTLTVQFSSSGSVSLPYHFVATDTPASIASALGAAINSSALVGSGVACPVLVRVQTFSDYDTALGRVSHTSIGSEIELYAYYWGNSYPTVSVTSTGGGISTLPNVPTAFSPGDGVFAGALIGTAPTNVAVTASSAEAAQNGDGLHLQGGNGLLFSGNHFGGSTSQNLNGVEVDSSGVTYSSVQVKHNNLTVQPGGFPVFFSPSTTIPTGLAFSENVGYNPIGYLSIQPTLICGTALTNPNPFSAEVYLTGTIGTVSKNGTLIFNSTSAAQTLTVLLGVGESLTVNCSGTINAVWFGV
jgi:hypothetical protein